MPDPKSMVMVSFRQKIKIIPSINIKHISVRLVMSLILTPKVVAFFLGHPVYIYRSMEAYIHYIQTFDNFKKLEAQKKKSAYCNFI